MDKFSNSENSVNKEGNSYNREVYSYINESNSYNSVGKSDNKGNDQLNHASNFDNSGIPVIHQEKTNITVNHSTNESREEEEGESSPKEIEGKLWEISELARRKKRLSPSIMEELIVGLCTQKSLMLKELAHFLERTPDGLRNNYLAKLLNKGELRLKYPDQINHPKQAYIVVEKQAK